MIKLFERDGLNNPESKNGKIRRIITFSVLFVLTFLRYCYFGLQYYAQLDDYIQYGLQEASTNRWGYIKYMGLLKSRPLAGVFDEMVWSRFFSHMVITLLILTALYVLSAMLFESVFRRRFGTSILFSVIYLLLPLNFEGTYWVSASSRLIPSLFFCSLCFWLLDRYYSAFETENSAKNPVLKKTALLVGYVFFGLFAVSFYEQGLLLYASLGMLVFLSEIFRSRSKRSFVSLLFLIPCAAYFLFTHFQPESIYYSGRMVLHMPWEEGYFKWMFLPTLGQIGKITINCNLLALGKGFIRGIGIIGSAPNILWCAVLLIAITALFFIVRVPERVSKKGSIGEWLFYAIVLIIAPLSVFFIVGVEPYVSCRNILASFPGAALLVDGLLLLCFRRRRLPVRIFAVVFAFCACVASVSEISDYKQTHDDDMRVVGTVSNIPEISAKIFGISPTYLEDMNYMKNEHLHGCTESNWALSGCTTWKLGYSVDFVPLNIEDGKYYAAWNMAAYRIREGDAVYAYDYTENTLEKLTVVFDIQSEDGEAMSFYREDGSLYGTAEQTDREGWFTPAQ